MLENKQVSYQLAITQIEVIVNLYGPSIAHPTYLSLENKKALKLIKILEKYHKARCIIHVLRKPPICDWIKCNSDGATRGNPGHASIRVIFRESSDVVIGYFAFYIGILYSIILEFAR